MLYTLSTTTTMIFNLGKNLLKYGGLFFFILIFAVTAKTSLTRRFENPDHKLGTIVKNDSAVTDKGVVLSQIAGRKVQEYDNKDGDDSRSSLNSVNLIIYMIYQVTNKSLR